MDFSHFMCGFFQCIPASSHTIQSDLLFQGFFSLCIPQTSSTSQIPVICRNIQMTLQSPDISEIHHGVETIILSCEQDKGDCVDFRGNRNRSSILSIMGEKAS
ncbi:hypothetical protein ATANTOWER_025833 [Ataeniobius toweri]|uniref:Uncharacterized protein n=1 Tax=Ataeniobius toweri TaxID=208326 RepID=A0ABU7CA56_9TELE|nr:hypothetical protein [Ataeniobius toweri]